MTTLKRQKIIAEVRMDVYAVIVMNKEDFFANLLSQAGYPDLEDFNWTVVRLTNYKIWSSKFGVILTLRVNNVAIATPN